MKKAWSALLIFLGLSLILRFFSFFPSVINYDESTYLVIARDIFQSDKTLYKDVIDTKPPGIFVLFGFIELITGNSIILFRLVTSLFVGFTAWFIYKFAMQWHGRGRAAKAAGFIYIFFVSTWKEFGMAANTELFFIFFNVIGLFFLVQKKSLKIFIGGLFFGLGFIIKYSNLFDFVPIALFFLIFADYGEKKPTQIFQNLFLAGIGFSLPFICTNLFFILTGNWESFSYITYYIPLNYSPTKDYLGIAKRFLDFHAFFAPLFIMFYYVLFRKNSTLKEIKYFVVLWYFFGILSILYLGNNFPHYFIQLTVPLSLLAGFFFDQQLSLTGWKSRIFNSKTGYAFLIVFILIKLFADYKDYYVKEDRPREIANHLQKVMHEDDVLYTGNYHHILYFLTKKESPTPYIHWTLMYVERLMDVMDIQHQEEMESIFLQQPDYVLFEKGRDGFLCNCLPEMIKKHYRIEKKFGPRVFLYRKTDSFSPAEISTVISNCYLAHP